MRHTALLLALVTAPAAAQAGLPAAEWRAANVFFSNFAEAYVEPFARGGPSDLAKIWFGLAHVRINQTRYVETAGGGNERIATRHVDAAAVRYFGSGIGRHESVEGATLTARGYVFPGAAGEGLRFAHVVSWVPASGGEFRVTVALFQSDDGPGDLYGTPVAALRRGGMSVEAQGVMHARVRLVREGGRRRYMLLEWLPDR